MLTDRIPTGLPAHERAAARTRAAAHRAALLAEDAETRAARITPDTPRYAVEEILGHVSCAAERARRTTDEVPSPEAEAAAVRAASALEAVRAAWGVAPVRL